jgi:hypothetical protein
MLSLSLSLLAYISDDVIRVRIRELKTLKDKLQVAQDRLSKLASEFADGKSRALSPLTFEITEASDVQKYYREYVRDLAQELPRLFHEHGPLHRWASRSYEEIHDILLNFGRSVFSRIRNVEIEQVIMDKREEETAEVRLKILRQDSIPFWNRDLTRMSGGGIYLEPITVIGVPDSSNTIYKEVREGEMLASTHNNHAITVLTTRHGLTLFALQQYDDYKRRYERHRKRQISPIHCFDVLNTRWMKTIFAVAQALVLIKKEGNRFQIYLPAEHKMLQEKIDLGLGLNNALERFLSVADHAGQVEPLIDNYIRQEGIPNAGAAIERYMNDPYSRSPSLQEIEKELKALAFDYKKDYLG